MTPGAGIFRTQLPKGFFAGGINCGVRRYRPDLGLIISDSDATVSAVYTQNAYKAAPIKYCQSLLPAKNIRAVVTNSGQANAATGMLGDINNKSMAQTVANHLNCQASQVLTASTGVIGEPMEIEKITQAVPNLVNSLTNLAEKFALAILTTDLVPKAIHKQITVSSGIVTITGICKGSGMIHPNMATMLGYLLSDVELSVEQSQAFIKKVCNKSFNMISVDGDTSTNDCVFLLTNGQSKVTLKTSSDEEIFYKALEEVAIELAKSIARDGEGASRLIQVTVSGLKEQTLAEKIARSITTSPLIKTAIYGESPNWGRILSRVGAEISDTTLLDHCNVTMQSIPLIKNGDFNKSSSMEALKQKMREDTVFIDIDFNQGDCQAIAWGCDLTEKYVKINAEYVS